MNNRQEQEKDQLILECGVSERSITWWKNEMGRLLQEAEDLDRQDPLNLEEDQRKEIEEKMHCLISRGEVEMDISDGLEEKIKNFHANIEEE